MPTRARYGVGACVASVALAALGACASSAVAPVAPPPAGSSVVPSAVVAPPASPAAVLSAADAGAPDGSSPAISSADAAVSTDAEAKAVTTAQSLPEFATCDRLTTGRCCAPSPEVRLCLEVYSSHHTLGEYLAQALVVTTRSGGAAFTVRLPLETRSHGSMKYVDKVIERLVVRVTADAVVLEAGYGCRSAAKPRSDVCAAEGRYGLRGGAFVRLDREE